MVFQSARNIKFMNFQIKFIEAESEGSQKKSLFCSSEACATRIFDQPSPFSVLTKYFLEEVLLKICWKLVLSPETTPGRSQHDTIPPMRRDYRDVGVRRQTMVSGEHSAQWPVTGGNVGQCYHPMLPLTLQLSVCSKTRSGHHVLIARLWVRERKENINGDNRGNVSDKCW